MDNQVAAPNETFQTSVDVFNTLDWTAIVVYFVIILIIVWLSSRHSKISLSGFFLAGRSMSWITVGASLFSSNIGAYHFIGLAGSGAATGIGVGAFELNALILLQLLGWVFLPVYIGSGVTTLPEYMKKRFGGERIRMCLAVLSLFLYIFTKISVDLYAGAIFVEEALHWNIYISILVLLALTAFCSLLGGLKTVIYIETFQFLVMLIGGLSLLGEGLRKVGGFRLLVDKYMKAIPSVVPAGNNTCGIPLENSWVMLRSVDDQNLPWLGFVLGQIPTSIWYWCADQVMVQRALASKSLSHAQGGTLTAGYFKILPLFMIIIPGMISRVLYPNEVGCNDPDMCSEICGNSRSCSNIAYPHLVMGIMPAGVRGIMLIVMISALMSDLISIFNSSSTLFTLDIWKKFRKSSNSRELIFVGRLFILLLVAISFAWVPIIQKMQGGQLFIYIQDLSAMLTPSVAAVYLMAILTTRINEKGAFYGIFFGVIIGLIRLTLEAVYPEPPCYETVDSRPFIISKVHYMYFAAIVFWITVLVSLSVSYFFPDERNAMQCTERTTYWSVLKSIREFSKRQVDISVIASVASAEITSKPTNRRTNNSLDDEKKTASNEQERNYNEDAKKSFRSIWNFLKRLRTSKSNRSEMEMPKDTLPSLQQKKWERIILNINLVLLIIICLSLYFVFTFAIHPSQ